MEEVKDRIPCFAPFFAAPARHTGGIPVLFCLTGVSSLMYFCFNGVDGKGSRAKMFACNYQSVFVYV